MNCVYVNLYCLVSACCGENVLLSTTHCCTQVVNKLDYDQSGTLHSGYLLLQRISERMLHYVQKVTPVDSCFFLFVRNLLGCYNLGECLEDAIIVRPVYNTVKLVLHLCASVIDKQFQRDSLTCFANGLRKAA